MNKNSLLVISDISADTFIKLKDAEIHCGLNSEDCEICLPFASKIPFESSKTIFSTGNGPNSAISTSKLGINTSISTNLGNDSIGNECIKNLQSANIDTSLTQVHEGYITNLHYVLLYNGERTILVEHKNYPRKFISPSEENKPEWVYLTSIGNDSESYHNEIYEYLEKESDIMLAFQPGTYQVNLGLDKMKKFYERAEILSVNSIEARKILNLNNAEISELLEKFLELGPKIVIITDGPKGAYMAKKTETTNSKLYIPTYPNRTKLIDRTGCGDAFFSTFLSAIIKNLNPEEAFLLAPINSMAVSEKIGPHDGLLSWEEIMNLKETKPDSYSIKTLS